MLLPESMSRIVIVGTKSRIDDAIDALYSVKAVHLIDHTTGADEGFAIGESRPYTSEASERLLKTRAMEKELKVNKHTKAPGISADEIKSQISSGSVESVENEVFSVLDERNRINQSITDLNTKKNNLEILSAIPVDLELYSGYKSITAIVGSISEDPTEALKEVSEAEYFISYEKKKGGVIAAFVKVSEEDKVSSILSNFGFIEIEVPEGTGSPAATLSSVDAQIAKAQEDLAAIELKVEELHEKHKSFLRASEEELAITVEQGSIPLRIATSEYSYVIDAWVPSAQAESVIAELDSKLGDSVYAEIEEKRGRDLHEAEAAEDRFKEVPTKMNNGNYGKMFEYPTKLLSVPKYQEIDPSILIGIFLPLFFGFMVGDIGYAIPFIILGVYGLKVAKNKDWRAIATVLFFGGIWAFIFGLFFFGEMLGMHFVGAATDVTNTWESLFSMSLPDWFTGLLPNGHGIGKIDPNTITFMLKLTVYVGIVHIMLGYICAYINVKMQHGNKAAFAEKGGWIFTFIGMVLVCWALTEILFQGRPVEGSFMIITLVSAVILAIGVVINFKAEKAQAILELPGIVGNILSYTRLAAIGMSKAGMALAFNYIAINMIATGMEGILGLILGFVVFAFGHLMIWTLAILSAGLHGLRLQFVELMSKFFVGGGIQFEPLTIKRKQTKPVKEKSTEVM